MLASGVVVPVHKAMSWITSFVQSQSTKVDGTIKHRICLDPRNLNKAIIREPCYYRIINDTILRVAGVKCITLIEMKSGYWQVLMTKRVAISLPLIHQGAFPLHQSSFWDFIQ